MEFSNVTSEKSTWSFSGVNLHVKGSNLEKTRLVLGENKNNQICKFVNITNSSFGQLKSYKGFQISISDSAFYFAKLGATLLEVTSSNVSIKNCSFENMAVIYGPTILNAISSQIQIQHTKFRRNFGSDSLIKIMDDSELLLESSVFDNNGGFIHSGSAVSVLSNSSAFVINSKFYNNSAWNGSCFSISDAVALVIVDSTFSNNWAYSSGGVMYAASANNSNYSEITIHASYIEQNLAFWHGGVMHVEKLLTKINIKDSIFENNQAALGFGGALYVEGKLSVPDTEFDSHVESRFNCPQSRISVDNTSFQSDSSLFGIIYMYQRVTLEATNCMFLGNVDVFGVLVASNGNCTVNIRSCYFTNSKFPVPLYNMAFYIQNSSTLTVADSSFFSETGFNFYGLTLTNSFAHFINCCFQKTNGFLAAHGSELIMTNCSMVGSTNTLHTKGFIEISDHSHLQITNSTISGNNILEVPSFIFVEKSSSLLLDNCTYKKNIMSTHVQVLHGSNVTIFDSKIGNNSVVDRNSNILKGILVSQDSNVLIDKSHFHQNSLQPHDSLFRKVYQFHLIAITHCKLRIERSKFRNNSFGAVVEPSDMNLIQANSANNLILRDNVFRDNFELRVLNIESDVELSRKYVLMHNCTFVNNYEYSLISGFEDVIISKSYFDQPQDIQNALTVRIADSTFTDTHIRFFYDDLQETTLFTYNTSFTEENFTLESNADNFLKLAESKKFIEVDLFLTLKHEDFPYASSRYPP